MSESPHVKSDVLLRVSLSLRSTVSTDDEGDEDVEYEGEANFTAFDRLGDRIDGGSVSDSSSSASETMQDTLDEVVHHYLRAYRL